METNISCLNAFSFSDNHELFFFFLSFDFFNTQWKMLPTKVFEIHHVGDYGMNITFGDKFYQFILNKYFTKRLTHFWC